MMKHAERLSRADAAYEKAKRAKEQAEARYEAHAWELRRLKLITYCREQDVLTTTGGERGTVLASYTREDGEPELNVFFGSGVEAEIRKVRGHEIAEVHRNGEVL